MANVHASQHGYLSTAVHADDEVELSRHAHDLEHDKQAIAARGLRAER